MATDARGHTVPAAEDAPKRADLTNLSLSIRDPKVVADATARAQYITDLAALPDPIVPSTSNPVWVWRTDAPDGAELEVTEDGTNWRSHYAGNRTPFAMATGTGTVALSSGSGNGGVTFPAGRFSVAPIVTATITGGSGTLATAVIRVTSVTASGCTITVSNAPSASDAPMAWHAIQMRSTQANG